MVVHSGKRCNAGKNTARRRYTTLTCSYHEHVMIYVCIVVRLRAAHLRFRSVVVTGFESGQMGCCCCVRLAEQVYLNGR